LDGLTSWTAFQWQFVAENSFWTPCEKATYLIASFYEPAVHILHGVPTAVTYEEVTEALESLW
jgi:hypothetical protein